MLRTQMASVPPEFHASQTDNMAKVSIITPAYNAADYLPDLIQSVASQTWDAIEHIIIDDGSTDSGRTRQLLERNPGIVRRSRQNRGQYATINEGLAMASGEVVTIISADDLYSSPTAIAEAVECLRSRGPAVDAVYGRTRYVNERGTPFSCQPPHWQPAWMLPYRFPIAHCSMFVRRTFLESTGIRWNEGLKYVGDAVWIMDLLEAGMRLAKVGTCFADYRIHANQISSATRNDRRMREHAEFDRKYGVVPWLDAAVRVGLGLRKRGVHFVKTLRDEAIVE